MLLSDVLFVFSAAVEATFFEDQFIQILIFLGGGGGVLGFLRNEFSPSDFFFFL